MIDTLGLRLEINEPRKVSRTDVAGSVTVGDDDAPEEYRLVRRTAGEFRVDDVRRGAHVGWARIGQRVQLANASFVLLRGANAFSTIVLQVVPRQVAIDNLQRAIRIDRPARDANSLSVTYRSTDPIEMPVVLNCLVRRYIAQRQDVQKAEVRSAVRFLQTQIDTLSRQLAAADDSVLRFRERANIVRLDQEATSEVSRLVSMQADRSNLDAERASLATLIHSADSSQSGHLGNASYQQLIASPSIFKNAVAAELLQSLTTLEDQRAALLTRRTPRDPDVAALTARIEAVDDQVRTIATTYLSGLNTQIGAIDQTLRDFNRELQTVPGKDLEYARLQRSTTVLSNAFALLQTRLKEAQIAQAVDDPSVRVVDAAVVPTKPLRPRLLLNLAAGAVLALVLAVASALVRDRTDRSIRTRADVDRITQLPVLGFIPSFAERQYTLARHTPLRLLNRDQSAVSRGPRGNRYRGAASGQVVTADAYARLFAQLNQFASRSGPTVLMVTSPMPGDGKTTNALNLALTVARQGRRALLIDGDLRHRGLTRLLGLRRVAGLTEAMLGNGRQQDLVRASGHGQPNTVDVVPAGLTPVESYAIVAMPRFRTLLNEVSQPYDVVVIDTPPLIVPDAVLLSEHADGILLVVRAGATARHALEYAAEQLHAVNARTAGVVLNDVDFTRGGRYDSVFEYYGSASQYVPA